jgi:hypothetical protein
MTDFFISYNKADRSWAEWIAWHLEEAGYRAVIQDWDFRPGSNFVLAMDKAAKEARSTIAVLSPDYLEAAYTHPEWAGAFSQDPKGEKGGLLPVRVRECEPKGLLALVLYIDLVGLEEGDAKDKLLAQVRGGRAKPDVRPVFPGRPPHSIPARPSFPAAKVADQPLEGHAQRAEGSIGVPEGTLTEGQALLNGTATTALRPTSALSDSPASNPPTGLEPAVIRQAEQELTAYLGPIAKVLVRRAARDVTTPAELHRLLAAAIPDENQRKAFLRRVGAAPSGQAAVPGSPCGTLVDPHGLFSPSLLETICHDLMDRLGPIANVLINQALSEAGTPEDFYRRLADHLPAGAQRTAFLKRRSAERG